MFKKNLRKETFRTCKCYTLSKALIRFLVLALLLHIKHNSSVEELNEKHPEKKQSLFTADLLDHQLKFNLSKLYTHENIFLKYLKYQNIKY